MKRSKDKIKNTSNSNFLKGALMFSALAGLSLLELAIRLTIFVALIIGASKLFKMDVYKLLIIVMALNTFEMQYELNNIKDELKKIKEN